MTWGQPPNDSSEAWSRATIRNRIAAWKRDKEWANLYVAHDVSEWDSAHVDWTLDEIVADGGVWVATFGEIAAYVRQFHVTVEDPVEGWNDSLTASAPLHSLPAGPILYVVVVAYDTAGVESGWSNEVAFQAVDPSTDIGEGPPASSPYFVLSPPRPNPMNPTVTFPFALRESARVTLRIHDLAGRLVATLLDSEVPSGRHDVAWQGTDASGREAGSGVYFCRMETPWGSASRRIHLLR
jgi:hypothetical protein